MKMKPLQTLRDFRKQLGLTHREMAARMGIHRVCYTKTELGYRKPDISFIHAFKKAFNLTAEEINRIFIDPVGSESETTLSQPTGTEGR